MYNDYYPFGMLLPNRHASSTAYRYGYQGSEKDDELKGEGNSYTTHFRQYDPRVARWLTIDPKANKMPWQSPYIAMDNNPIKLNDQKGDCPQCITGAIVGLLTEYVAQVGYNMFVQGMDFDEANSNIDGTDLLVATGTGLADGFVTGGLGKATAFFTKTRNRKVLKMVIENTLDFVLEATENIVKDFANDKSIDVKGAVIGALVEMGLGKLLPSTKLSKKVDKRINAKLKMYKNRKKFREKISKRVSKPKHQASIDRLNKSKARHKILDEFTNIPQGAVGEIGGNLSTDDELKTKLRETYLELSKLIENSGSINKSNNKTSKKE